MELHIQTKEYGELIKLFCDEPLTRVEVDEIWDFIKKTRKFDGG